ncbi:oxidoreductase [Lentzea cavernae]|uniref:Oxidoreductase n=2 Tax=Lentzea cavernae TaxID=2020703 RepID=A0ABQ3MUY6_9PSEU|nr:oxidoreductase [Lentzea cavernae]
MIRAAEAGEVLDLSRRGNNVVRATAIRDLVRSGDVDPRGLLLVGARVTGQLDLNFISTSTALQLDDCVFEEPLLMYDAELPALSLDGSTLPELRAENLRTRFLALRDMRCAGVVDLENARVDGSLRLTGATASLLFASGLHVTRSVHAERLYASRVWLDGCEVGGGVDLSEAVIVSESGLAFVGTEARIGGDLRFSRAFVKAGTGVVAVALSDATCRTLKMNGTVLRAPAGSALLLDGAQMTQEVRLAGLDARAAADTIRMVDTVLGAGLVLSGSVRADDGQAMVLHRTKVGASITITDSTIESAGPLSALDLTDAVVNGELVLRSEKLVNRGSGFDLDLSGTKVGNRLDLGESKLVEADVFTVTLNGLTYPNPPADTHVWLKMLRRNTLFYEAQPYQQLAAVHRAAGHEHTARKVLIAQQEDLRRYGDPGNKLWHWFLGVTLGYGYRPSRAVAGLLVTFLLAIGLVWTAGQFNGLTPAKDRPADSCSPVNRISLAADLAIPLVKLGGTPRCELANGPAGQWATGAGWAVQILGWSFATLSVAGFTGLVRKN